MIQGLHVPAKEPASISALKNNLYTLTFLVVVFLLAAVFIFALSGKLTAAGAHKTYDTWFLTDTPRVFDNLNYRLSDHYRTSVHPLSSILLSTPTIALRMLGCPAEVSVRIIASVGAGFLAAAFFSLCRLLTGRIADALIFTLLLTASASFLFFASVPELYVWGAASMLCALLSATVDGRCRSTALVTASAGSLSFTVTNWMAGLVVVAVTEPFKRAALYTALSFAMVAMLVAVQSNVYPTSGKFFYFGEEQQYIGPDPREKLAVAPRAFFVESIIFPGVGTGQNRGHRVLEPHQTVYASEDLEKLAFALWVVLLVTGVCGALSTWRTRSVLRSMAIIVGMLITGQFILHLFYGEGYFLYSLHYAPFLVLLASFSSHTAWRPVSLVEACLLTAVTALNNISGFELSLKLLQTL